MFEISFRDMLGEILKIKRFDDEKKCLVYYANFLVATRTKIDGNNFTVRYKRRVGNEFIIGVENCK